jgi:hypothetical protein
MALAPIREEYDVFVHDGETAIGAVREVGGKEITVYVEGAGDFRVAMSAVREVEAGKVTLDCGKLDAALRRAIGHAHDDEDPYAPDRPLPGEND